jgi:diketogulonate reductase-like aldo/keto reductase
MKFKQLNQKVSLPMLGFGTWKMEKSEENESLLHHVQDIGFDYIDTAMMYDNEEMIGDFIVNSKKSREQLFISTKVGNDIGTYQQTINAIEDSLKKLKTDYIDLVLIHWPSPIHFRNHWQKRNEEVYRALEDLLKSNKIRSIGISNFMTHHVKELLQTANVLPAINQIECHPYNVDTKTIDYCEKHGISIQCYSPLGQGSVLKDKVIQEIAQAHNKTTAQIILNWHLTCDRLVVTNSSSLEHIKQNYAVFDFTLSKDEINRMSVLSQDDGRILPHPDQARF